VSARRKPRIHELFRALQDSRITGAGLEVSHPVDPILTPPPRRVEPADAVLACRQS
jgi:hypothetical protein